MGQRVPRRVRPLPQAGRRPHGPRHAHPALARRSLRSAYGSRTAPPAPSRTTCWSSRRVSPTASGGDRTSSPTRMSTRPSGHHTSSLRPPGPSTSSAGARLRSTPRRTSPLHGPMRGSRSTTRARGRSRTIMAGSGRRSRESSVHEGSRSTRAIAPSSPQASTCDRITTDPVAFSTGQPDAPADATLWAIGRVQPNTGWLPESLLDEAGFVRVSPDLTVAGAPGVFAIGDVAATDPLRSSARNRADRLLASNIRRHLAGRPLAHLPPPPSALGLGPRIPAGRAARVHTVGHGPSASLRGRSRQSSSPGSCGAASTAVSTA